MLLQQSPFRGEDEDEIYDAILADEPLYPIHMPRDSVQILQQLLTREPEQRLGSGPTDAQEIMSQAFFKNVNWDDVYHKRLPSPFMPQITSATDTSNFDSEFTSVTPVLTPVQSGWFFHSFMLENAADFNASAITTDARGIPWFFIHGRLCVSLHTLTMNRTKTYYGSRRGRKVCQLQAPETLSNRSSFRLVRKANWVRRRLNRGTNAT